MSDDIVRAAHAKRLMEDSLLVEILDAIEEAAIAAWSSTAMQDNELREMAYQSFKASRRVRDTLKSVVDSGLVAANANRAVRP